MKKRVEFVAGLVCGVVVVIGLLVMGGVWNTAEPKVPSVQAQTVLPTPQNEIVRGGESIITSTATVVLQSTPTATIQVTPTVDPTSTPVAVQSTPVVEQSTPTWVQEPWPTATIPSLYPVPNVGYLRLLRDPTLHGNGSPTVAGYAGKQVSVKFYAYIHDNPIFAWVPQPNHMEVLYIDNYVIDGDSVSMFNGVGILTWTIPANLSAGFHNVAVDLVELHGQYIGIFTLYVSTQ